jgi:hypothetical protein
MNSEIIVGALAFIGTCVGTIGGIIASARLTNYRLAQLEKEVGKFSSSVEELPVIKEQIKVINHRLDDLEKSVDSMRK